MNISDQNIDDFAMVSYVVSRLSCIFFVLVYLNSNECLCRHERENSWNWKESRSLKKFKLSSIKMFECITIKYLQSSQTKIDLQSRDMLHYFVFIGLECLVQVNTI